VSLVGNEYIFIGLVIIANRVHADLAGVSVQLGPWKVLTSLPLGSLKVSASNSLWIVIMRLFSFALSRFDSFMIIFAKQT
jgi:hypothetical protein